MIQFETTTTNPADTERRAIVDFLASIDPAKLSAEALGSLGWGDDNDPVAAALQILRREAQAWPR